LWLLSGAPESNNFASAEATGAAKKIKIEKANPPCPKAGKINRGGNPFCTHPIATAPSVCYNNHAQKRKRRCFQC
ncbi:MAG: hypothetical protein ACLT1X_09155, partial [Christensenellales bacterium]